jgi:Tol biopolymer transport system component
MNRRVLLVAGLAGGALTGCAVGLPGGTGDSGGTGGQSGGSATGKAQLVFGSDNNIQTMATDGSGRATLTRVPQGGQAKDPVWAPDGKSITYAYMAPLSSQRGPGGLLPLPVTDVYTMKPDGSDQKVLVPHDAPGIGYEAPVWHPDGKSLVLTYTELVMESNLVKDQIVEVARITPGAKRQTLIPNGVFPTVSRDGQLVACVLTSRDGRTSLVVAGIDGKNQRALTAMGEMEAIASPRFSPDGKQIAFSAVAAMAPPPTPTRPPGRSGNPLQSFFAPRTASAHGLPMDVFVINVDGGPVRRLTQLGEDNPSVTWSPDGKRLAILAGGGIYTMLATGEELVSIDQKGGHGNLDWKPA